MSDNKTANAIAITPVAALPALPAASPASAAGSPRPYVNERMNSRSAHRIDAAKPAWSVPLDPEFSPRFVLAASGRVVVAGSIRWEMFAAGKRTGLATAAGEDAEISASTLYATDHLSQLACVSLDAAAGPAVPLTGQKEYLRTFVHRHGDTVVVASALEAMNPVMKVASRIASLQTIRLGAPDKVEYGRLVSAADRAYAEYDSTRLCVAAHNEFIVAARQDTVEFLDLDLVVRRKLTGTFRPLGLSLDESGRIYLLVDSALWILAPNGDCLTVPLDGLVPFHRPPIVGYDHRVYLVAPRTIRALNPDGKTAWTYQASGQVAGAIVTAGGNLLVAAGDQLVLFNSKGQPLVVRAFPGESLRAAPALAADGEVVVVTDRAVHCLRA